VLIGGRVVDPLRPRERDVAMVFQNYALYPHMTVARNIATPLMMAQLRLAERLPLLGALSPRRKRVMAHIDAAVSTVAEQLRITPLLGRKPAQLSGGQRQRVALARAMVRRPAVFLMDEPLSNLDAKLRIEMRQEIRLLQRELGITTIYVTHDQEEALAVSDRIAVLERGHLLQIDVPRRVYEDPAHLFVADFIGGANKIPGRAADGGVRLDAGPAIGARLSAAAGTALTTTLRIEDLRLAPETPDWLRLPARVVLASYLGARQRLACALADGTTIEADLDPGAELPASGGAIDLWFSPAKARIFDAADGRRVG
jgi:multiple sugar transport system ATP-binding protein